MIHLDSWDSTGEWVVYTSQVGGTSNSNYEIYTIKSDGSEATRMTTNVYEDSNASFGSDGYIYFGRDDGNIKVWRIKADGTEAEEDLSSKHPYSSGEYSPKVSPDAAYYAYMSNSMLYVTKSDGTGTQQQVSGTNITVEAYNPYSYSWDPDSEWIVYVGYDNDPAIVNSNERGPWIYKVKADGSEHQTLSKPNPMPATGDYEHTWPTWSPDGAQIAYVEKVYSYVAPNSNYLYKLRLIDTDGNVLEDALDSVSYSHPLTDYKDWYNIKGPLTWSPDSNWLGYRKEFFDQNDSSGTYHSILIVNIEDTSEISTLTSGYYDYSPLWSPAGNQILFTDSDGYYTSRDDSDDFGVSEDFMMDLLLLNLSDNYLPPLPPPPPPPFAWPMFMPAIIGDPDK